MNIIFKKAFLVFTFALLFSSCHKKNEQIKNTQTPQNSAQRIISLSPAITEIIFAINAQEKLIGRSEFCNYPEEAKNIECVAGFDGKTISIEKILSFNPDFIFLSKGMHDFLIPFLEKNKINYYLSDSSSISSILEEILFIGTITNHQKDSFTLTQKIQEELNYYSQKNKNNSKRVLYLVYDNPLITIGKTSFINEVIQIAGGINIFSELESPYPTVSPEAILLKDPEVIITLVKDSAILKRKEYQNINAIKNNKIYFIDPDIISRPGPRITQAVKLISEYIYE